jgi:hypothetical protein
MEVSTMKKRTLGMALLALAMVSVARDASADESNSGALVPIVFGGGALDFGLAMTDLVAAARQEWLPRGYGAVETAVGGAQFAICLELASTTRPSNVGHGLWAYGAVFGAILTTHGLVTLLAPRSHTETPAPSAPVVIAPLALSDVARAAVPGMAVLGRF